MSSKVASRAGPAPSSASSQHRRAAPYQTNGAGRHNPPSSSYSQARRPAVALYRVEKLVDDKGVEKEVLTIEDTPPPGSAAALAAAAAAPPPVAGPSGYNGNMSRSGGSSRGHDAYSGYDQPPSKKRRGDGGSHVGDQAYGSSSSAASSSSRYKAPLPPSGAYGDTNGTGSKSKRARVEPEPRKEDAPTADKEGHFIVNEGTEIWGPMENGVQHRFRISRLLGQGTFGKVVAARRLNPVRDGSSNVAIKVIRNVPKYREAAKVEVKVLESLRFADPKGLRQCIKLEQHFDFKGHTCLVTELLSSSVFDFLKENSYNAFPYSHVQSFAKQLFTSINYVHSCEYIHTDLKPENILLEDTTAEVVPGQKSRFKNRKILKDTSIRLIDFGSATAQKDYHAKVVSTRHYRAPEIILGMEWSYPCDVWSIGCILVEFVTGEALFQTHENLEHLAMMEKVFGKMPARYADKAARGKASVENPTWFKKGPPGSSRAYELAFPLNVTSKQSAKFVKAMKTLPDIVNPNNEVGRQFVSLLQGLLRWDVKERTTVAAALAHPFFSLDIRDEGSNPPVLT